MDFCVLADATVDVDAGYLIALLSRVAHTTCAATLLGGLMYLRFVLAPAASAEPTDAETVLFAGRRKAWAACVGVCTALLLVSGFYNFFVFVGVYQNLPALYHPLFGVKFLLALGVMVIMALVAGRTGAADRVRGSLTAWLNVALVLTLVVFLLGAVLRSFRDLPDARAAAPAIEEAPAFDEPLIEEAP
ncbi:hypothetical protein [Botrimarina sp.]|uniref:hypothetical protein n=1 Tax=Botrimarina sp. TaxID=2795802 RepID=UPI0032EB4928